MPSVYLSPSTAENQVVATGGNEEYYMNLVADAMIPYLRASGISFDRNDPGDMVRKIIDKANSKYHDLYLALNMESSLGELAGKVRGQSAVYYTGSPGGKRAAEIFARNLKTIYPVPQLVEIDSNRADPELRDTDSTALVIDLGYRDNVDDAEWVSGNIDVIAKNLALSLSEFLNIRFVDPTLNTESRRY